MGTYASLSTTDKATVQAFVNLGRVFAVTAQPAAKEALALSSAYVAAAKAIIDGLDAAQVVPNTCGYTGAADLTKEDVQSLFANVATAGSLQTTPNKALTVKCGGTPAADASQ